MSDQTWKDPEGYRFCACSRCWRPSLVLGGETWCMVCIDSTNVDNPGSLAKREEHERQRLAGYTDHSLFRLLHVRGVNVNPRLKHPEVEGDRGESVPCYTCARNGRCHPNDGPCPDEDSVPPRHPEPQRKPDLRELAGSDADLPAPECYGSDASELEDALEQWWREAEAYRQWQESPAPCGHSRSHVTSGGYCIACAWKTRRGGDFRQYPIRGPGGAR